MMKEAVPLQTGYIIIQTGTNLFFSVTPISIFIWCYPFDASKGACKLAPIIIAVYTSDLQNRFIGVLKHIGRRFHLLFTDKSIGRRTVYALESVLDMGLRYMEVGGYFFQSDSVLYMFR